MPRLVACETLQLSPFQTVQDVGRPEVRRWITETMNDGGLKPKTGQRILSALRG